MEQFANVAGGQTVALQLAELTRGYRSTAMAGPPGPLAEEAAKRSIAYITLNPKRVFTGATKLRRHLSPNAVLLVNGPRAAPLALAVKSLAPRTRLWYYVHGRPGTGLARVAARILSQLCDRTICVAAAVCTASAAQVIHNCARPEICIDPATVDEALDGPGAPVRIKFLGRNDPIKGLDVLLEALPRMQARQPFSVEIAVGESLSGRPARNFSSHDLRVELVGPRDASWISPGDIVCVPSRFEASPLVVHESMARGACVVASRVGGIPELLQEGVTGYLSDPDPASLAKALDRAVDAAAERAKICRRARKDADARAHAWEAFWRQALAASC